MNQKIIVSKLETSQRLTKGDALWLYENASLEFLSEWALKSKKQKFGDKVFYNRNIHFEPTNVCVYSCKFCAFYRKPGSTEADGAWDFQFKDLKAELDKHPVGQLTEVHITGGVHPDRGVEYGIELCRQIREYRPEVHIKAFTAVEITFFARKSKLTVEETLLQLKEAGLDSLPGGGAEIFNASVRKKIAGGKAPAHRWLEVHATAHKIGLASNATMLYGHLESFDDRIDHMSDLRDLQDKNQGFMSFIPLRYLNQNNALSDLPEVGQDDDFRNFAVSRLFCDNIPHLKAYWVMTGMDVALESMKYGVDDLDGTIDDSTKIYSMAGGVSNPKIRSNDLQGLIASQGAQPCERNSLYEEI